MSHTKIKISDYKIESDGDITVFRIHFDDGTHSRLISSKENPVPFYYGMPAESVVKLSFKLHLLHTIRLNTALNKNEEKLALLNPIPYLSPSDKLSNVSWLLLIAGLVGSRNRRSNLYHTLKDKHFGNFVTDFAGRIYTKRIPTLSEDEAMKSIAHQYYGIPLTCANTSDIVGLTQDEVSVLAVFMTNGLLKESIQKALKNADSEDGVDILELSSSLCKTTLEMYLKAADENPFIGTINHLLYVIMSNSGAYYEILDILPNLPNEE